MQLIVNEGKQCRKVTDAGTFERYAIKTHFVQLGESYIDLIQQYVAPVYQPGDIVSISEKVISLCQKRIVYKSDMKISRLAKFLSRFASSSDAGIGVDCVWKMQFAIDHCGPLKILFAAFCGALGKLVGRKGLFYDIAGEEVRGLDGFYDKSFSEYGNYGIRLPEDPTGVCNEICGKTGILAAVVDVNDYTCDILGVSDASPLKQRELTQILKDNPSGQSTQLTPLVLIRPVKEDARA